LYRLTSFLKMQNEATYLEVLKVRMKGSCNYKKYRIEEKTYF
jgi:hypothetical protein